MSQLSISALTADVATNIYTNKQRLIKGNTIKQRLLNFIDSTLNKTDHANAANGYVAIASDGTIDMTVFAVVSPGNKFLRDDGTWQNVEALPLQSGNSGKFLTTNGSAPIWATLASSSLSDFNTSVDERIANWVGAAPSALNTLDELAAALGDDANFAGTITTALSLKAPLASPTFTGTPAGPTATAGTNTTQLATTAFVTTADNLKANIASPTFTGTPAAPTATAGTNSTQIATTAFVVASFAPLASPTFTGTPAAPTATAGTNTTQIATTAFVTTADNLKANIVSPTFTGTPAAPTASGGTNTTQIATCAFVQNALGSYAPLSSPTFNPSIRVNGSNANISIDADPGTNSYVSGSIAGAIYTYLGTVGVSGGFVTGSVLGDLAIITQSGNVLFSNDNGDTAHAIIDSSGYLKVGARIYSGATGTTPTAYFDAAASTSSVASLRLRSGAAVTSPNPGDMWNESNKLMFRATDKEQIAFISNLSSYATTSSLSSYAPLASPTFTGAPSAPTASAGTNTTQIATTAFVTTADNLKANIASPTFTGTPAAPTASFGTNTTQIATTAFVQSALSGIGSTSAGGGDEQIQYNTGGTFDATPRFIFRVSDNTLRLNGGAFFGATTATTPTSYCDFGASTTSKASLRLRSGVAVSSPNPGDMWNESNKLMFRATDVEQIAFISNLSSYATTSSLSSYAPLASPTFTGTPAAPTASAGTNTTQLATTAFVTTADNLKANIASPTFTGTPAAPTASGGTNTTQIATTAFVQSAISGLGSTTTSPGGADEQIQYNTGGTFDASSRFIFRTSDTTLRLDGSAFFGGTTTTPTSYCDFGAATTSKASLRIRSGTRPTHGNSGEIYFDGNDLFIFCSPGDGEDGMWRQFQLIP